MNSITCAKPAKTVKDGIVNRDIYFSREKTPVRILFLLKEANDPNGGGWDLCEYIRNGARWQTWNNATRWAIALGVTSDQNDDSLYIDDAKRKDVLSHIAVMNLKKVPGGSASCTDEIRNAAKTNAALLKQQITYYEPDVIVCCGAGVADGLESIFADSNPHWIDFIGHRYGTFGKSLVLDFWHPAARKSKANMVKDITLLYREARQVR